VVTDAHVDGAGRLLVTGVFEAPTLAVGGHTVTSAGSSDALVAAIDADGRVLSVQSHGGTGVDAGSAIVASPSALYLLGHVNGPADCGDGAGDPAAQNAFLRRLSLP
jgi:hypothetical protein